MIAGLTSEKDLASIKLIEKLGMRFERIVTMSDNNPGMALCS